MRSRADCSSSRASACEDWRSRGSRVEAYCRRPFPARRNAEGRGAMKPGSWPSIILIYCYGVLASASISKLIPLSHVFTRDFAAGPAEFALLIALITLPAAFIGAAVGGIIDRFGTAQALVASAILGALANILYLFADRMLAFEIIRVFEGLALVGIYASAPALIMATTTDKR